MNLPKKLKEDSKLFPRHIIDENKKDVALMYNYDERPEIKEAIIKRYNNYPTLLLALIGTSIGLCLTVIALLCLS